MAPKSVSEAELVQWLLDEANRLGPPDWGYQRLAEFIELRDTPAPVDDYVRFVERLVQGSTATGSAPLRPTVMFDGNRVVRGYELAAFKRAIAGPGAKNQAMQIITIPDGGYYRRLRRCAYSECQKFFLPEDRAAGPLDKYCSEDHRTLGYREKTLARVNAFAKRKKRGGK